MQRKSKRFKVFSALEVANICGVVNQTAINWIKKGYLKAYTTPGGQFRVTPEALAEFLKNRGSEIPPVLQDALKKDVPPEKRSILIVDDDKSLNTLIKKYIEKNFTDITIYQAFDGFEAGSLMVKTKPGFVILDLDLPGIDGFSLCSKLKSDVSFENPFTVVITALKDADVHERIASLGSNYFLTKPVSMNKIGAIVNQWLSTR